MYKNLDNNKKKTFSAMLQATQTTEAMLEAVSYNWYNWLLQYYQSKDRISDIKLIPFYVEDKQYQSLYKDIMEKNTIKGFSGLALHKFPITEYHLKPCLILPLPNSYQFFQYNTTTQVSSSELTRGLKRKISKFPRGFIIFGFKDNALDEHYLYSFIKEESWFSKQDLSKVSLQLEELRRFGNRLKLNICEAYITDDCSLWKQGLIVGLDQGFFDIKLWKGK